MDRELDVTAGDVLRVLTRVVVPGFGINPVDLGLIYGVEVAARSVRITMTLPDIVPEIPANIRFALEAAIQRRHPGMERIEFDLVWDPLWREDFITADGLLQREAPLAESKSSTLTLASLQQSLRRVIDPELGINVVDLGLIRQVTVNGAHVIVTMTLTTPGCPLHASIEGAIQRVLETCHPALTGVTVTFVWDPPWSTADISPAGRAQLVVHR